MPIKSKDTPSREVLEKYFSYDPDEGILRWKIRKNRSEAGSAAGSHHIGGYITVGIMGELYLAHRLVWAMVRGVIPDGAQIDHINGDRKDNRISNLRLASHSENCRNSRVRKHNKTGLKGVKVRRIGKWECIGARIRKNGKEVWLGGFKTIEEAHAAYCKAADEIHKEFSNFG